jgi:hypothetical protein
LPSFLADHVALDAESDCWLWTGRLDKDGYGVVGHKGADRRAHRASYEALRGSIPPGLVIDHLCRVRNCINPDHMEPVTNAVNVLRGEGWAAKQARQTSCKRGHPFAGANLFYCRGSRRCRACHRAWKIAVRTGVPIEDAVREVEARTVDGQYLSRSRLKAAVADVQRRMEAASP